MVVRSSGTCATEMKVELGWVVRPLLRYDPVVANAAAARGATAVLAARETALRTLAEPAMPLVKLESRFCGQGKVWRLASGSKVQGPPIQPSLAIRKPTPWWKVGPLGVMMSGKVKAGPLKLSWKSSLFRAETGH